MTDFQSLRVSLASDSIIRPRERTNGQNGGSEGGCRRRFSRATALEVFLDEFGSPFGHRFILGRCQR
jgi:hypothetical protein